MSELLTNGVTIMLNGQIMVTKEPCEKDCKFIGLVKYSNQTWIKEGKPLSNQG